MERIQAVLNAAYGFQHIHPALPCWQPSDAFIDRIHSKLDFSLPPVGSGPHAL